MRRFITTLMLIACVAPVFAATHAELESFLDLYCVDCHASDIRKGEVTLEGLSAVGEIYGERAVWERVFKQVKVGAMPPDDEIQPEAEDRSQIAAWLEERLNFVDLSKPVDPGRVTVRRLNRTEYDNTIQDLFGIGLSLGNTFPSDNVGYGFDNIGDVHTVSPLRMERFLEAAEKVTDFVMNTGRQIEMRRNEQAVFYDRINIVNSSDAGVIVDPHGKMVVDYETPLPGTYELQIRAWGVMPESVFVERGIDAKGKWPEHENAWRPGDPHPPVPMEVWIDGERVASMLVDQAPSSREWKDFTAKFKVSMGRHQVAFQMGEPVGLDAESLAAWRKDPPRLGVREARMVGPIAVDPADLHPTHRLVVTTKPDKNRSVAEAARTVITHVGPRAYRRPMDEVEVERLVDYVTAEVAGGESFDQAMEGALQALLISPHFLYRMSPGGAPKDPDAITPLDAYALASRLSYFLWGSMPDDALMASAASGALLTDRELSAQVTRMLRHDRADHFKSEFFRQWLDLRKLRSLAIDGEMFKEFSLDLKRDVETETLMFVRSIIDENGSITDMLKADHTFINGRLAAVYGISGFDSSEFQRVSLKGMPRRGLLTQPSILMLTSYPNRTSPTKRGNWILEAILGDEPPAPPANVPTLEDAQASNPNLTLREHLELHRTNQTCAACHATMDPIGLGLENYNAIGQWRVTDEGRPVNASGELPDGSHFDDPLELLDILMAREDDFARNFTRKLMTFALGRGLEYYDRIAIDDILAQTKPDGYRIVDIATAVVLSRPFRLQRGDPEYLP